METRKEIIDYVAEKALEDIRNGRQWDKSFSKALNGPPYLDPLCKRVEKGDIKTLMGIFKDKERTDFEIAISLLKKFTTSGDTEVKAFLQKQWEEWREKNEYEHKFALMWRLIDYKNIDINVHTEIYDLITVNSKPFGKDCIKFCGGGDNVLGAVRGRLANPDFPKSKHWFYLCVAAMGSSEKRQTRDTLTDHFRNLDRDYEELNPEQRAFLQRVIEKMIRKLGEPKIHGYVP